MQAARDKALALCEDAEEKQQIEKYWQISWDTLAAKLMRGELTIVLGNQHVSHFEEGLTICRRFPPA